MKDKIKYVILIGSIIALGIISIKMFLMLKEVDAELEQVATEQQETVDTNTESEELSPGLYGGNMEFIKESFMPYWEDLRNQVEEYCTTNDIDYNELNCTSQGLQYTNDYNPYVIVEYSKGRLMLLFDTHVEPVELFISELDSDK